MKGGRAMSIDGFPPVVFVSEDHERLSRLAFVVSRNMPDVSEYLKDELERATVVDDDDIQPTVDTMGPKVTFRAGEGRVGKECVSMGRSSGEPVHTKKQKINRIKTK